MRHEPHRAFLRQNRQAHGCGGMRPWESLLLLMDLLAFVFLSVRGRRWVRTSRAIIFAALALAAAQWLAEGPRWQMFPAYALTLLFLVAWLLQNSAPAGKVNGRRQHHRTGTAVAVTLGALGLAIAAALPMLVPVFRFPHPSGPYAIGTLTYHWTDASRAEAFAEDPNERRQLMVQVWYPAQATPSARRAAYITEVETVTASFARLQDKPTFLFGHLKYVSTNAMSSAGAAGDQQRYPVLLFLEGATGFRQMNTFQVEHLVSHGYVVVAIDQPGAAAAVVFPQGHHAVGLTVPQLQAMVRPSYMPVGVESTRLNVLLPNGSTLPSNSIIPYLAQDVSFALDQLVALNQSDPHGRLAGKLDLQRVGVFGVSLGGIVAGEACRLDSRLQACLVMDAPMSIDVVRAGLKQPGMWITRDVASMRLERTRAGGWPETEIEAHQSSMRTAYEGLAGAGYFVRVPGMFHGNLTDVASWTPLALWLGLSGPVGAQRAHDIINAYSLGFFDRHLAGRPAKLLDGAAKQYPEVLLESRRP
jgi:predicted dienelactone hydrolase